jgi:hypothetical protein
MNGLRKCGIYTQWNFTQPFLWKEILSFTSKWIELENFMLHKVSQAQKDKNHIFSLSVDYRPTTISVILLDMGHTLRV